MIDPFDLTVCAEPSSAPSGRRASPFARALLRCFITRQDGQRGVLRPGPKAPIELFTFAVGRHTDTLTSWAGKLDANANQKMVCSVSASFSGDKFPHRFSRRFETRSAESEGGVT